MTSFTNALIAHFNSNHLNFYESKKIKISVHLFFTKAANKINDYRNNKYHDKDPHSHSSFEYSPNDLTTR